MTDEQAEQLQLATTLLRIEAAALLEHADWLFHLSEESFGITRSSQERAVEELIERAKEKQQRAAIPQFGVQSNDE